MKNKLMLWGVAAAIGIAYVGVHYRIRIVITVMFIGLTLFSFVSGVYMILTRRAEIAASRTHMEYHSGLSAQLWGVLFLMASVPVGAFAILYSIYGDNPPAEIVQRMMRSPLISGLCTIAVGVALVFYGLTRVLPGKAAFVETKIGPFERGISAVYSSILGSLVVTAGVVRVLAPGTLTRMRDAGIAWVLEFAK